MIFGIDHLYQSNGPGLGLSVAIDDLTRAWLRHTRQRPCVARAQTPSSGEHFLSLAQNEGLDPARDCIILDGRKVDQSFAGLSCLFVPDPALSSYAWARSCAAHRPSLCGLVHTLSGDQVARALFDMLTAPTDAADALVCPSKPLRDSLRRLWDDQIEHLNGRFGGKFHNEIQTPVIPLGIDSVKFETLSSPDKRNDQRSKLNIAEDEVVILFVGRLNFATKAHPLPLLQAVAKAAQLSSKKLRLILYGYFFPKDEMEPRFQNLVRTFADKVSCDIVTNDDPRFPDGLWAAADVFTSLIDNIQESFGLTPIEAMACGLPSVISDWDGYRDGVRDGQEGFLITTCTPPAVAGVDIARNFAFDGHYGHYLVGAAQSTSIDTDAAAQAFARLANDSCLRQDMGTNARKRAKACYDWRVIIPAYESLWTELAMRRAEQKQDKVCTTPLPLQANPYDVFAPFPSTTLNKDDLLSVLLSSSEIDALLTHDMNYFAPSLLLPAPLMRELIEAIRANGALSIDALLSIAPPSENNRIWRSIGWMLKHGICRKVPS